MNDRQNGSPGLDAHLPGKFVGMTDDAIVQRAVGISNTRTCMGHTTGSQTIVLQKRQPADASRIFADARIIKNAQGGTRGQRKSRRT